jgi:hypothetical protein
MGFDNGFYQAEAEAEATLRTAGVTAVKPVPNPILFP